MMKKRFKLSSSERFGTYVWRAVMDKTYSPSTGLRTFTSLGEIAKQAQVSNATAKKYLMHLVKMNVVATFPIGKRWVYQYIGDGRDI